MPQPGKGSAPPLADKIGLPPRDNKPPNERRSVGQIVDAILRIDAEHGAE
jgi:hypothetical protein